MINKYFIFILTLILFVSCSSAKESFVPDNGPKNIKFSPVSGKAGDVVTITGDDFFSIEKMDENIDDKFQNEKELLTRISI